MNKERKREGGERNICIHSLRSRHTFSKPDNYLDLASSMIYLRMRATTKIRKYSSSIYSTAVFFFTSTIDQETNKNSSLFWLLNGFWVRFRRLLLKWPVRRFIIRISIVLQITFGVSLGRSSMCVCVWVCSFIPYIYLSKVLNSPISRLTLSHLPNRFLLLFTVRERKILLPDP